MPLGRGQTRRIWSGARDGAVPGAAGVDEYHEYKGWWHDTGEPLGPRDWAMARAWLLRELGR